VKPTSARSTVIATAPSWMFDECSSRGLDGVGRVGGDDVRRQPGGGHERPGEQQRAVHQRRRSTDQLQQDAGRHDGDAPVMPAIRPELRVGLDELGLGPHRRRHDRRLRHRVGLLQHERGEHEREQHQRVEVQRHQQGEHHARHRHHWITNFGHRHPVDQRPDQRRDHEERREAEHEEQQDPRPGGVEVDVEEQRVGERDHHRGVAAHHQGVGDREAAELRRGRSLRSTDPCPPSRSYGPGREPRARRSHWFVRRRRRVRCRSFRRVRTCSRGPGS
jgi:hypothetical protein